MAFISKEEVQEQLGDNIFDIFDIVKGGCEDYENNYDVKDKLLHCSTTKASIIHDHQIARAASYAVKNKVFGAKLLEFSKLKILLINEKFAIRFKKLNSEKKSSNQLTQQVKDFLSQETLNGIEVTHNLEAGYVLPANDQELNVYLTCPSGHMTKPHWDIELLNETVKDSSVDLFQHTDEFDNPEDEAIIHPKRKTKVIQLSTVKKDEC